jgi:putative oxidoreductase
MTDATSHLYVPALGKLYGAVNAFAEPILRIALGAILIPHGLQKLFGAFGGMGLAGNAALFDRIGYTPGIFWGTLVGCTELIGGGLLIVGLFTRFAAAAVLIFMIVAVKFTSAKGFFWSAGGYEYPLLIGACALFFLIRGGGHCSLDRDRSGNMSRARAWRGQRTSRRCTRDFTVSRRRVNAESIGKTMRVKP